MLGERRWSGQRERVCLSAVTCNRLALCLASFSLLLAPPRYQSILLSNSSSTDELRAVIAAGGPLHVVTGRLAAPMVRYMVEPLASKYGFRYSLGVLPISVAALMTPKWLRRHLEIPDGSAAVILPGYLQESLPELQADYPVPLICGPKDVRDLPRWLDPNRIEVDDLSRHRIEIFAEINHAPRMELDRLVQLALGLRDQGADVIDLGCTPGSRWSGIAEAVKRLRDAGLRLSIDTFDAWEAAAAAKAGVEWVLSVNGQNGSAAVDWGCGVVVVPDDPQGDWQSMYQTADRLASQGVSVRLDPILEPIGCGLAESLVRYRQCRRDLPEASMLMGIGNLTELTDCDSAGINVLLLGICEELRIESVLTTQVISWAQSSVAECDRARRLVHFAVQRGVPPKNLDAGLVMLRDTKRPDFPTDWLGELQRSIKDNNYRIVVDGERIHLLAADVHIAGSDPFAMMDELLTLPQSRNVDLSHAFYLGFELSKALTALTLGKNYQQDQALDWGLLTRHEPHHRLRRTAKSSEPGSHSRQTADDDA
jgi:dihydropteroate synthase